MKITSAKSFGWATKWRWAAAVILAGLAAENIREGNLARAVLEAGVAVISAAIAIMNGKKGNNRPKLTL
jgi:hypothetical protein